jgi:hypothetical protein
MSRHFLYQFFTKTHFKHLHHILGIQKYSILLIVCNGEFVRIHLYKIGVIQSHPDHVTKL